MNIFKNENGDPRKWVLVVIWTAMCVGAVVAACKITDDQKKLADPNSELSKRKAVIEQQCEQERKESENEKGN